MSEQEKDFEQTQAEKWFDKAKDCPARKYGYEVMVCSLTGRECRYHQCLVRHWGMI